VKLGSARALRDFQFASPGSLMLSVKIRLTQKLVINRRGLRTVRTVLHIEDSHLKITENWK